MATLEQQIEVVKRIEDLQQVVFQCKDDGFPVPSPGQENEGHHRDVMSSSTGWDTWAGLSLTEATNVLKFHVDWSGFTEWERADVIQRVVVGEEPGFWMDGIEWIVDFHSRIEELKRDGVPDFPPLGGTLPWAEATEARKLENIVWESMSVWPGLEDTFHVRDEAALAVIEQNIDFSKLPEEMRESLSGIRSHESIGAELQRIAGFDFDDGDDHESLAPPSIRPLTEQLITASLLDIWPGNAAIIDFGIDSDRHLGALQYAIRYGEVTPEELDAAMGSGAKLTEIAQRGDNPYRDVVFETSWDRMRIEPPDDPSVKDDNGLFAEVRADEFAARVRDYGEADAATYDQRVRDGASTIRHPEPVAPEEIEKALTEVERSWPVGKETPAITGKAALERLLFGDKKPEVKQPEMTKDRGIEI